jgi:rhodanese-related sulfurtransferase
MPPSADQHPDVADKIGARIMPAGIGRDELRKLTSQGAQLVEVLPADEYEWAHLPGAVSLPLKELNEGMGRLDRSRPVIVYCHDSL